MARGQSTGLRNFNSTASTQSLTFSVSPSSGSTLVLMFAGWQGSHIAGVSSAVDSNGKSFTRAIQKDAGSSWAVEIWRSFNIGSGVTSVTVTLSNPSDTYIVSMSCEEATGLGTSPTLDASNSGLSTNPHSLSINPTGASRQVFHIQLDSANVPGSGSAWTNPSGWTNLWNNDDSISGLAATANYNTLGAGSTAITCNYSLDDTGSYPGAVVAFAPTGGGGSAPTITHTSTTLSGQNVTVVGTYTSSATPTVTVTLTDTHGATMTGAATAAAGSWSATISSVTVGTWTSSAAIVDSNGAASVTGSAVTVPGVTMFGYLPLSYTVTSATWSPSTLGVTVGAPGASAQLVSQDGIAISGATVASGNTSIVTATTPTSSAGVTAISYGAVGSAIVTGSYTDPTSGVVSAVLSVTVSAAPTPPPTGGGGGTGGGTGGETSSGGTVVVDTSLRMLPARYRKVTII